MGVLPSPKSIEFVWPDAFKQNPLERAQTSAQKARALANVSKALSDKRPVISCEEGRAILNIEGPAPISENTSTDDDNDLDEDDSAEDGDNTTGQDNSPTPPSPAEGGS